MLGRRGIGFELLAEHGHVDADTIAKNLVFWILSGELFPLDLISEPWRSRLLTLPFPSGVFLPVGYTTGRVGLVQMQNGFISVTVAILILNIIGSLLWKQGLRSYEGTGA